MEQKNIRILIVDDDEEDFMIIRDLLGEIQGTRYLPEWKNSYRSALEAIQTNSYDIYLFDYRLGVHNGLELLQEITRTGSRIPVVFLTGLGDHEIDLEAMHLGASDYLIKSELSAHLLEKSIRYAIEQKKIETELFQEKEQAIVTLESIGDAVIITDTQGNISHLNKTAENLLGWLTREIQGQPFFTVVELVNETTRAPLDDPLATVADRKQMMGLSAPTILINREGREMAVEGSFSPICNHHNQVTGLVIVFHDVTENRELAKKISYQASHDFLTGLDNRMKLEEKLDLLLGKTTGQQEHAFFYMDLDHFKMINDTCGHFAGDQLLKQISALIRQTLRQSDAVARIGGDEFGVLLENCPPYKATEIAAKICNAVGNLRFIWKDKTFSVGVSIGVVIINIQNREMSIILSSADQACYIAKKEGGNRFHLSHDGGQSDHSDESQWLTTITKAFEEERFYLNFQPIVPFSGEAPNSPSGGNWFEVLIRMKDDNGNLIYPNHFLPVMQHYKMMPAIDQWVVGEFFSLYERFLAGRPQTRPQNTPWMFNINISGASFDCESFWEFVQEQFDKYHLPPALICFEITETTAITNFNTAIQWIRKLKNMGCRLAIDDFGSGLASFHYLRYLPIDYIKIDGSIIKNSSDDTIDYTMVSAINQLAHLMGIKTIAEFVEDQTIYEKIQAAGVDYAQGYHISKPVSFEELLRKIG